MRRAILAAYRVRAPILYASAAILILNALTSWLTLAPAAQRARGTIAMIALAVFLLCAILAYACPALLRPRGPAAVVSPVQGRWVGLNSPESKVPSHGIRAYGQAYAIDLAYEPPDAARPKFGDGTSLRAPEDYPAFGEPVFAMIEGAVVRASSWRRDHRTRSSGLALIYMMIEGAIREIGGPGFILGNHVVIRGENGDHALVAHLQRGSVPVRVGDRVHAGQQIGRCGNSGNTSEPHVHAQLMDRASVWTAQGVPMVFAGIVLEDNAGERADALPGNGQRMLVEPREREVPPPIA